MTIAAKPTAVTAGRIIKAPPNPNRNTSRFVTHTCVRNVRTFTVRSSAAKRRVRASGEETSRPTKAVCSIYNTVADIVRRKR